MGLPAFTGEGLGSIAGQELRSHKPHNVEKKKKYVQWYLCEPSYLGMVRIGQFQLILEDQDYIPEIGMWTKHPPAPQPLHQTRLSELSS